MSDALDSLNGLIVPLTDQGLLLPNVAVAELVSFRITRDKPGAPNWFLGWTRWRDQQVPLVDPYRLLGQARILSVCGCGVFRAHARYCVARSPRRVSPGRTSASQCNWPMNLNC